MKTKPTKVETSALAADSAAHDPRELARLQRPQPPTPVPPRARSTSLPGLIAQQVLGGRVVRRFD